MPIKDKLEIVTMVFELFFKFVAICLVLAVFIPKSCTSGLTGEIAKHFGISGWVYYEVGNKRELTTAGQLYLLKATPSAMYYEIDKGDKLRAASPVNFHDNYHPGSTIFTLNTNDCITVISKPNKPQSVSDKGVVSGGWLEVSTSPCRLFD